MSNKESSGQQSRLHIYSLGVAAANIPLNESTGLPETTLHVTPIEQFSMMDGEVLSLPFESEVRGQSIDGSEYSAKVTLNAAITATWLPMNSNRITPPNIRRGERVIIWRYADTDEYRWTETGWDDHLRRLETVKYRFSATADENADGTLEENAYWLMVSTHLGQITLTTAQANGEKAKYILQINARDGVVVLTDTDGNMIQMESLPRTIGLRNADGTSWVLDKKRLIGYAEDQLFIRTGQKIHFQTKDILFESNTFTHRGQTATFDTAQSFFKGTLEVDGATKFKGTVEFEKPVTMRAKLTAAGIQSSLPIQGPSNTI